MILDFVEESLLSLSRMLILVAFKDFVFESQQRWAARGTRNRTAEGSWLTSTPKELTWVAGGRTRASQALCAGKPPQHEATADMIWLKNKEIVWLSTEGSPKSTNLFETNGGLQNKSTVLFCTESTSTPLLKLISQLKQVVDTILHWNRLYPSFCSKKVAQPPYLAQKER